jgi:hypothetical protein
MKTKPECEGCKAYLDEYNDFNVFCGLPSNKNGVECPCMICVVKSMCHLSQCDDFKNYLGIIWGPI